MTSLENRKSLLTQAGYDFSDMRDDEIMQISEDKIAKLQPEVKEISDEFHPEIPLGLRAAIKAFGVEDSKKSLEYARSHAPNLQWAQKEGSLLAKLPKEQSWKKLDPSAVTPGEFLRDIMDLGYDLPAGALASLPLTAGPSGLVASSAIGTGLEALKEKIGKDIGVRENFSPAELSIAAAAPVVPMGVAKATTKVAIPATAQIASYFSGVPKEALQAYAEKGFKTGAQAISKSEEQLTGLLKKIGSPILQAASEAKQRAAAVIENALLSSEKELPAGVQTSPFKKLISDFVKSEMGPQRTTGTVQGDAELKALKDFFMSQIESEDGTLTATQLFDLQKRMDQIAKYGTDLTGKGITDQRTKILARNMSQESKKWQNKMFDLVPDSEKKAVGVSSMGQARGEYATSLRQEQAVKRAFGENANPYTKWTRSRKAAEEIASEEGKNTPIGYEQLLGVMHDIKAKPNQGLLNKLISATSVEQEPMMHLPTIESVKFGGLPFLAGSALGGPEAGITAGASAALAETIFSNPKLMSRLIEKMGQGSRLLGTKKASTAGSLLGSQFNSEE